MKSKRQFILDTLLPYKEDPSVCGFENGYCSYKTPNGKHCAIGKHMVEGEHQDFDGCVVDLTGHYCLSDILTEEAKEQQLSLHVWGYIQLYHDKVAKGFCVFSEVKDIEDATKLKFPELYP